MKTPREILLARHRHVEPKLDALRRKALTTLAQSRSALSPAPTKSAAAGSSGWSAVSQFIFALLGQVRWHVAAMSALWLVAAWFGTLNNDSPAVASEAKTSVPLQEQIIASLRENRRQVSELLNTSPAEAKPSPPPAALPGGRRSERRSAWPVVATLV
jgi:hypothetical protein